MGALKSYAKKIIPAPIWNKMRLMALKSKVKNFSSYVVEHRYGAQQFKVYINDPMARGWYDKDWDKLEEIEFLKEKGRLVPGKKVFDLGTHQGVVAMMLAKEVGAEGHVVGVEANSHNVRSAEENFRLNDINNVKLHHAAIGETSGTIVFNEGLNGSIDDGSGEWGQVEVKSYSIDDFIAQEGQPDIIYLDIEGFEACALRGSPGIFENPCDWFIEVHGEELIGKFGGSVADVLSYFPDEKYDCFMAGENEKFTPLDRSCEKIKDRFFFIAIAK
jgi:FkbM family methyltransferase